MKKRVIVVLFPIVCLLMLTLFKQYVFSHGKEFILKIEGYDPRDILSGHYVTYVIDYENRDKCKKYNYKDGTKMNLCLDDSCAYILKGKCFNKKFIGGIERFYIPEARAREIDRYLRDKRGKLKISVMPKSSKVVVKDILIDDLPFKDFFKKLDEEKK